MQREIDIMLIKRIPPLGKLIVESGGTRYEKLSDIADSKKRQLILAAIGELVDFAGSYQNLVDAGLAPAISGPQTRPLEEKREAFLKQLEEQRDQIRGSQPSQPSSNLTQSAPIEPEPVKPNIDPNLSIVEQIDSILQGHIKAEKDLSGRSIHLTENPEGGLRILIDGKYYNHPRKVPDSKIQALIKQSLKDWENR